MKLTVFLFLSLGAIAQDLPTVSPLESFLRTVDQRSRITETPPPNTIQAALAFTDAEMQSLNAIARSFVNRASNLRAPTSEMVFQARLDLAETGKESETVKLQMKAMSTQLAEAVAKAASQLRVALGDERYQKFDAWLQGGGATGCWLAPCSATPKR